MRSILLVKTSSLGDVVHNLPVVSDLRSVWPSVAIDWVVEEAFADIPRMHPGVRAVLPVAIRRWRKNLLQKATWQEIRQFTNTLRQKHYDLVIDTQGLLKSALITRYSHGLRCGFSKEVAREPLAAHFYDCTYGIPTNAHAVVRNRWLAAAAAGYNNELPLRYGLHAPIDSEPAQAPYCVLLTATSRDDKLWPLEHWQALGQTLATAGLHCILPAGNPQERARATRIADQIPSARVAPPASISALAGLLEGAHCIIGVDTGLTHLAAALDRPVVALYVATDPEMTGVHAGPRAINLGRKGHCPAPAEVMACLHPFLKDTDS
jgi:heptosyltransferase-1